MLNGKTKEKSSQGPVMEAVDPIELAFQNAEPVNAFNERASQTYAQARVEEDNGICHERETLDCEAPIRCLGHNGGYYFFIPPSGQLRKFSAVQLETGRGVRALFLGGKPEVEEWCLSMFPDRGDFWCHKRAGLWIIEKCNEKGVFEEHRADLRDIGVWRDENEKAVYHCGGHLIYPDGQVSALTDHQGQQIMIGAGSISKPDLKQISASSLEDLLGRVAQLWGWKRPEDARVWLGWVAAASLGGFVNWRVHLYVHGNRGSGKSKLMELAACLLGDLAGDVLNDATEAGVRQSRNNQARPLLIDEFEPENNSRSATRQDSLIALLRRMSGGAGGRISRGGSDHSAVSFRALGAVCVTSINHIELEPQDRSRFAFLELLSLPDQEDPSKAAKHLTDLFAYCKDISARFRGRMLVQSIRWEDTYEMISIKARQMGADNRQADTAATIAAGLDLALFDTKIDDQRLNDCGPLLEVLLADVKESDIDSEGLAVLDFLLCATLQLDHGVNRSVRELIDSVIETKDNPEAESNHALLRRHGIYVNKKNESIALRTGKETQTAKLYRDSKWRNGAHASAMTKLEGVTRPTNPVRVARNEQHRVVLVPFAYLHS